MATDRRDFLKKAALAGAGLGLTGGLQPARGKMVLGKAAPNDRVLVAVMGVNGRGNILAKAFAQVEGAEVGYVADVDERAARKTVQAVSDVQESAPKRLTDFRRALDDEAVDALVIAAPDHWHAPAAILALNAGKHVYVEKPCSHNAREGELLVEAQRKYDRVVQMGNQRRSWNKVQEAMSVLQDGAIGPVHYARSWYSRNREALEAGRPQEAPAWLDWGLWQGPAPRRSFQDNYVPYNWHWFQDWGTGEAGNNGIHMLDLARWGLGAEYPTRVTAAGGRYVHDQWQLPDGQMLTFEYDNGTMATWEGISFNRINDYGASTGVLFQGAEGTLLIPGNAYVLYDGDGNKVEEVTEEGADYDHNRAHIENFLAAIRTGETPRSHIEGGHKSTVMCHLANIAHRTGRTLRCDPSNGHIQDDEEAMQHWGRTYEPGWEPKV